MRQPYLVVGALLVGLLIAGRAVAQVDPGRIPSSALGAQGSLSDKDQEAVVKYVDFWVKEIQSGDGERITLARGRLTEPYNQGGTESFITFFDQTLASRIGAGLQAKDVVGKMNALIVAQKVRHEKIVDVIKAGLKEEASAVSYQAAVAAEAVARNKNVATLAKLGLVKPLSDALKKEKSPYVLEYLYRALAEIEDPAGWEAVLTRMNEQIGAHAATPDAAFDAEFEGAKVLQVRLISYVSNGGKLPEKTLHLFLLANVRFMELALRTPSADRSDAAKELLILADQGARWAGGQLVAAGAKFKVPETLIKKTDDEARLFLNDWKNILKGEPLKFADAQIALPVVVKTP